MSKKSDSAKKWKSPFFVNNAAGKQVSRSLLLGRELRQKVHAGWALGTFLIDLPCPATLTAMSLSGFDFIVLDMEHSTVDFSKLETLINAGQVAGLTTLVRVWGEDTGLIGKVLDMGAHGIMAPHVSTPERAREIVEQSRFAPQGNRGFSPITKYNSLSEPLDALNEATYVVIQIEGRDALENVSDIARVPGVDAIFVGPYDLALSLGVPPGSPQVSTAAQKIAEVAPEHVGLGIYIDDPATCGTWAAQRFTLQCVSFDGRMISDGARSVVTQAKAGMDNQNKKEPMEKS